MRPNQGLDQPTSSLFDRLTGSYAQSEAQPSLVKPISPGSHAPSPRMTRRGRANQLAAVRQQIQRDLLMLLSTRRMAADTDLSAWPLVAKSVLNFGIPDLAGITSSSMDLRRLQKDLVQAIKNFEPRLHPESLTVSCHIGAGSPNDLLVEIEALFGPADALESFAMGISICLSDGQCLPVNKRNAA